MFGWGTGEFVELQTTGPESVSSGNEQPLIALRCLLLTLVSTPLRIVNRC